MNLTLDPELEKAIQEKVEKGDYDSPAALIEGAVRRLIEEDKQEAVLTREVQARIEAAEAEVSRGEYAECDESELHLLARDIHERGLQKIAAERDKNNSSE